MMDISIMGLTPPMMEIIFKFFLDIRRCFEKILFKLYFTP